MKKGTEYIFVVCFVLLLLAGCKSDNNNLLAITFNVTKDTSVALSEIVDHTSMIKLETKEDVLLKEIKQVEIFEEYILIKDVSPELYVFDMSGKFIRTIGKKGSGPGEYNSCTSFSIDYPNRKILLKTNIGIMTYDISGQFLDRYLIKYMFRFFYSDNYFYSLNNKFSENNGKYYQDTYFSKYDLNWSILDSVRMYRYESGELTIRGFAGNRSIFKNDKNIYVFYPGFRWNDSQLSDTLYSYTNQKLTPFLSITLANIQKANITNIYISGRFVIASYSYEFPHSETRKSQGIHDIITKKTRHTECGFVDDIYNNGRVILSPMFQPNMFYGIKEEDYSDELKMEPNPTIYIGMFKK